MIGYFSHLLGYMLPHHPSYCTFTLSVRTVSTWFPRLSNSLLLFISRSAAVVHALFEQFRLVFEEYPIPYCSSSLALVLLLSMVLLLLQFHCLLGQFWLASEASIQFPTVLRLFLCCCCFTGFSLFAWAVLTWFDLKGYPVPYCSSYLALLRSLLLSLHYHALFEQFRLAFGEYPVPCCCSSILLCCCWLVPPPLLSLPPVPLSEFVAIYPKHTFPFDWQVPTNFSLTSIAQLLLCSGQFMIQSILLLISLVQLCLNSVYLSLGFYYITPPIHSTGSSRFPEHGMKGLECLDGREIIESQRPTQLWRCWQQMSGWHCFRGET